MSKFKVGDRVRQVKSGYGTSPRDNGREAIVVKTGGNYCDSCKGIVIKEIGYWYYPSSYWRGEEAFVLVERKQPKVFGIVSFCKKYYK